MELVGRHAEAHELRDFERPFSGKDGGPDWNLGLIRECIEKGAEEFQRALEEPQEERRG